MGHPQPNTCDDQVGSEVFRYLFLRVLSGSDKFWFWTSPAGSLIATRPARPQAKAEQMKGTTYKKIFKSMPSEIRRKKGEQIETKIFLPCCKPISYRISLSKSIIRVGTLLAPLNLWNFYSRVSLQDQPLISQMQNDYFKSPPRTSDFNFSNKSSKDPSSNSHGNSSFMICYNKSCTSFIISKGPVMINRMDPQALDLIGPVGLMTTAIC